MPHDKMRELDDSLIVMKVCPPLWTTRSAIFITWSLKAATRTHLSVCSNLRRPRQIKNTATNSYNQTKNTIMKYHITSIASLAAIALAGSASAANIAWGSVSAINSSADVSTNGTLVMAIRASSADYGGSYGNSNTVNGVLFDSINPTQNGVTFDISGFVSYDPNSYVVGAAGTPGTLESAYQQMLTGAWFGDTSPAAFTLSGLTVGQEYELQVWVADYRQFPPNTYNRSQTLTAGNTSGSLTYLQTNGSGISLGAVSGSYIIGTFTADTSTQSITLNANSSTQLNALQLRAIPEPSAALLGGLGLLALARRRR